MTQVLVCRVGRSPAIEELRRDLDGSHVSAAQLIVGGWIQCITLDDGVDLWCNEDGIGQGLPLNRCIPTVGRSIPRGFGFLIDTTLGGAPSAGEPAEWRIHGDFFLARTNDEGETTSITDADVEKYSALFAKAAA